jgi:hypothetical protein
MVPTELETRTFTVVQLLDAIRKGRVRIPHFQRGFRWIDEDRRMLFDSVQHGFPIGTLLLARGHAPADRILLAGYAVDVPEVSDAFWVVDGQQRVATLAMALLEDHSGAFRPIYFDLLRNAFVLGIRRRSAPPHWVPSHVLLSSSALNRWLREYGVADDLSNRADEIAARIREYALPAYLVPYDGKDDSVLRQIFARTNRRGRALETHEVFEALHKSFQTARGPIQRVLDRLGPLGFGTLDGGLIERTAVAVAGGRPGRDLHDLVSSLSLDAVELFELVATSLALTIDFLVNDAGVPHLHLLPYNGVLCSLARFFASFSKPHPRNRELMSRWFWRGTLTGDHRTDNGPDSKKWMAIDGDEHQSVQRLLRLLRPLASDEIPGSLARLRRRDAARTNIELLALADLNPLMLAGAEAGAEVPIAPLLNEGDKTLPWQVAKRSGEDRTIAGDLLHPRLDSLEAIFAADESVLASHGIDAAALAALRCGDHASFLKRREELLGAHLRRFLLERTAVSPADRDRAPLDAYFGAESA